MKKRSLSIVDVLKQNRFKVTPIRVAILELFNAEDEPLDADHILTHLKSKQANQVTVYRTLTSFETKGILKRVDLRKDSVHYEIASDHHHHIVCTDCGDIEDFESCAAHTFSSKVLSKSSKFKILTDHSFEFFGICKKCVRR